MRKVEAQMIQAIRDKRNWRGGNTEVRYFPEVEEPMFARAETSKIYLHGNWIATYCHFNGKMVACPGTFREYPTRTTASRLRALGVHATIKGGEPCIDGEPL